MSESSKFKFGLLKEKAVDGFINDIMALILLILITQKTSKLIIQKLMIL